eukprot:TRINITY_DN3975_c0_g1_i1.p1 TRINITY_DN3975_c0_g1~~TRINITY_DN3975_c0_g1_i1.p1  ORF type:complete len:151 (+),score=27.48 TRINITY_DN3975_c0_g1_i1:57-509(+)
MNFQNYQQAKTSSNFQNEDIFEDFPLLLQVKHTLSSLETTNFIKTEQSLAPTPNFIPMNNHCYIWTKKFEKSIQKFLDEEKVFITEAKDKQDKYFEEKKAKISLQILLKKSKNNQENEKGDENALSPIVIRKKRVSCIVTQSFSSFKKNS